MVSYFLNFLEEKKEGTIACLVKKNSYVPLFALNISFKKCTGKWADQNFDEFFRAKRKKITKHRKLLDKKLSKLNSITLESDKIIHSFKGQASWGGKLFYISTKKGIDKIIEINKNGKVLSKTRLEDRLITFGKQTKKNGALSRYLPISFGKNKKKWFIFDLKKKRVIKELSFKKNTHYLFLNEKKTIQLRYLSNKWSLYQNGKKLYSFPEFFQIYNPQLVESKESINLNFKSYFQKRFSYQSLNIAKKSLVSVYKSNQDFHYIGSCKNINFIKRRDGVFGLTGKVLSRVHSTYDDILFLQNSKGLIYTKHFLQNDKIYSKEMPCNKLIDLKREYIAKEMLNNKIQTVAIINDLKEESYPSLRHFKPKYWLLGFGGLEEDAYFSASSSINDPKSRHNLALRTSWFTELEKIAPIATYSYSPGTSTWSLFYSKFYDYTELTTTTDSYTRYGGAFSYEFALNYWTYTPQIILESAKEKDFISARDLEKVSFLGLLEKERIFPDSFIQSFSFLNHSFYQDTKNRESFIGHEIFAKVVFGIGFDFKLNLQGSYGKLNKNELSSGAIFGGSNNTAGEFGNHDFYGLDYRGVFGNEIMTSRIQFDFNLLKFYWGPNVLPLYLRELNLLLGADYAKSDFINFKNFFYKNESIYSLHGGVRLKTVLFYGGVIDLDLIYAKSFFKDNQTDNNVLFLAGLNL